jgi:phosphatidate cytidylyltransferase
VLANWVPHVPFARSQAAGLEAEPWAWIAGCLTAVVLAAFLAEMVLFRVPGESITRISLTTWVAAYLGLLPSFLVQLRWLNDSERGSGSRRATAALALAIFVPKCCDIGAYFTGRFLGKHKMSPVLSPKKTWEGLVGGLALAVVAAIVIDQLGGVVHGGVAMAAGLGLALGMAGALGDLAESLIKRDCEHKDASNALPGFGGILDVVDSVLFAAPVAYWWMR